MKDRFYIANLISKEKLGELTQDEQVELKSWIESGESNYEAYIHASKAEIIKKKHDFYRKIDSEKSWKSIQARVPGLRNTPIIFLKKAMKWAAVLLLPLMVSTYLLNELYLDKGNLVIEAGAPQASLVLSNGETILLEDFQGKDIKEGRTKLATNSNNNLIYKKGTESQAILRYNTISTPVKGEYAMTLSDGTRVWLNAQSSLKYPVKFGNDKRVVELKGEAYFEVARDTSKAFIVNLTNGSDVEVLGTSFNVMSYEDEEEVQTTLVEGKVKFSYEDSHVLLSPGKQSGMNRESNEIDVREVDAYQYTAWKDGKFVFSREPMSSVFRKISRWYGVDVQCSDQDILNRRISGVTDRYDNINELIDLIEEISPLNIEQKNQTLIVSME